MGNDAREDETGRFSEKHPQSEFLQAIQKLGGAAGTQEVADAVGCPYDTAYSKLKSMEEEGLISSRKVANARLWETDSDDE